MSFKEYMYGVGLILLHSHGCEPDKDFDYRDLYDRGCSPEEAVEIYFKKTRTRYKRNI